MNPRLYLETTIPSYLVARPSRDLRLAADQQTTREWWESHRQKYDLFISEAVRTRRRAVILPSRPNGLKCCVACPGSPSLRKRMRSWRDCSMRKSSRPSPRPMRCIWRLPPRIVWTSCSLGTARTCTILTWSAALPPPAGVRIRLPRDMHTGGIAVASRHERNHR